MSQVEFVSAFIKKHLHEDPKAMMTCSDLWRLYRSACRSAKEAPVSSQTLLALMGALGAKRRRFVVVGFRAKTLAEMEQCKT